MPGEIELHEPDDETWALGEERLRALMELAACGRPTAAALEAAARDLGIGRSRCYELLRRYRRSPTVTALLPRARGRARGARMLAAEVEAVVAKAIDGYYLDRRRPPWPTSRARSNGGHAGRGRARLGEAEAELAFRAGAAQATLRVPSARFWGPRDPHLYPLAVTLTDGQGRATDSYALDVGIRTVEVRGDRLLLNGEPVTLRGFGKHEDFPLHGRGFDLAMWVRDYELLRWTGANSYRTTHYPYAEEAMDLADQLGVLVINEIPAVGLNFEDPEEATAQRLDQALRQLRELVARDKNHPSTVMWCVANEPLGGPPLGGQPVPRAVEAGTRFFRRLYDEAKRLDATRPVTLVGVQGGVLDWHGIFDVVCVNRYFGWYTQPGRLDEAARVLEGDLDGLHRRFGKPVLVTEFGTDTLPGAHAAPPEMWSEEYQVEYLRRYLDVAARRPFVAGMHVWNFADFKTGQGTARGRHEPQRRVHPRPPAQDGRALPALALG